MFLWYVHQISNQILVFPIVFNIFLNAEDGKELLIDVDSKKKEEILSHCLRTIGKSR